MNNKNNLPNYGNWVPERLLCLLWGLTAVFVILGVINSIVWKLSVLGWILWILALLALAYAVCMQMLHHSFSFKGGGVMGKIHGFIIEKLGWNGKGRLLDIGCGSGALAIRCAKKFPEAEIVGLDYWGAVWDYAKKQCETNARLENADNIEFIKGDASALSFEDESFDAAVSNFVFHEVRSCRDKRALVREGLRVVKKGGSFAFHDMFDHRELYGDIDEFVEELKSEGISEIHYMHNTENQPFVPGYIKAPFLFKGCGLMYGIK